MRWDEYIGKYLLYVIRVVFAFPLMLWFPVLFVYTEWFDLNAIGQDQGLAYIVGFIFWAPCFTLGTVILGAWGDIRKL